MDGREKADGGKRKGREREGREGGRQEEWERDKEEEGRGEKAGGRKGGTGRERQRTNERIFFINEGNRVSTCIVQSFFCI